MFRRPVYPKGRPPSETNPNDEHKRDNKRDKDRDNKRDKDRDNKRDKDREDFSTPDKQQRPPATTSAPLKRPPTTPVTTKKPDDENDDDILLGVLDDETTVTSMPTRPTQGLRLIPLNDPKALGIWQPARVPPLVTKNGKLAFEVTYKAGVVHPQGVNANFNFATKPFLPSTQCRFAFKVWLDDNWPWIPGGNPRKIGGKLLGFKIGTGESSGGEYSTTGASMRLTFAERGGVGPYFYPQLREDKSRKTGNPVEDVDLDQNAAFWAVSKSTKSGIHMFYPRDRHKGGEFPLLMEKKRWNELELFVKLNTPGKYDGVVEAVCNGRKVRFEQCRYRYDNAQISHVDLGTFFGGKLEDYAPPQQLKAWFADFAFSTS